MTYAIIGSGAVGYAIAIQFARKALSAMLINSRAFMIDVKLRIIALPRSCL